MTATRIRPRSAAAVLKLTERGFYDQVANLLTIYHFEHVHFRPARTAHGWATPVQGSLGKGWPDITAVRGRDRRLLFIELKTDDARSVLEPDQEWVLGVLRSLVRPETVLLPEAVDVGPLLAAMPRVEVHVLRPADLDRLPELLR